MAQLLDKHVAALTLAKMLVWSPYSVGGLLLAVCLTGLGGYCYMEGSGMHSALFFALAWVQLAFLRATQTTLPASPEGNLK